MSSRRRFLAALSAGLATATAGCTDGGGGDPTTESTAAETTRATTTATTARDATETTEQATETTTTTATRSYDVEGTYPAVMATAGRTGVIGGVSGPGREVEQTWKTLVGVSREGPYPVMLVDDYLYATAGYTLARLNAVNGDEDWTIEFEGPISSPAAVGGGAAYLTTRAGLHAVDAATGRLRWVSDDVLTYTGNVGAPIHVDGTVYVVAGGTLYAVDAGDGSVTWNVSVGGGGAVALGAGIAAVGTGGGVAAVSLDDGSRTWTTTVAGSQRTTPRIRDGRVFLQAKPTQSAPELAAYDPAGEQLWEHTMSGNAVQDARVSGMAVTEDRLLAATDNGNVHSLSVGDGRTDWRNDLRQGQYYQVTVADATVYAVNDVNNLVAIDGDSGQTLSRSPVPSGCYVPPVVRDDTVYVADDQYVYAFA